MPTNIGFRVTGMFFGATSSITKEVRVDVPNPSPTVYDVMIEVVKKVTSNGVPGVSGFTFDPIFPSASDSLNSITIQYTVSPKSPYGSGIYFLQENKMGNPIYVFQYYIFDQNFVQKNNNNQTARFNAAPDVPIADNDIIVWRQVAILQGANGVNRVASEMASAMTGLREKGIL
jgi:hypothetical protein